MSTSPSSLINKSTQTTFNSLDTQLLIREPIEKKRSYVEALSSRCSQGFSSSSCASSSSQATSLGKMTASHSSLEPGSEKVAALALSSGSSPLKNSAGIHGEAVEEAQIYEKNCDKTSGFSEECKRIFKDYEKRGDAINSYLPLLVDQMSKRQIPFSKLLEPLSSLPIGIFIALTQSLLHLEAKEMKQVLAFESKETPLLTTLFSYLQLAQGRGVNFDSDHQESVAIALKITEALSIFYSLSLSKSFSCLTYANILYQELKAGGDQGESFVDVVTTKIDILNAVVNFADHDELPACLKIVNELCAYFYPEEASLTFVRSVSEKNELFEMVLTWPKEQKETIKERLLQYCRNSTITLQSSTVVVDIVKIFHAFHENLLRIPSDTWGQYCDKALQTPDYCPWIDHYWLVNFEEKFVRGANASTKISVADIFNLKKKKVVTPVLQQTRVIAPLFEAVTNSSADSSKVVSNDKANTHISKKNDELYDAEDEVPA